MSPLLGKHNMAISTLRHSRAACFLMGIPGTTLGCVFKLQKVQGNTLTCCWILGPGGQTWRSHILESRQFLTDRGLKSHSLVMPYLPRRNRAFPVSVCWESHTAWKHLRAGHFSLAISPDAVTVEKAPTRKGKENQYPNVWSIMFSL